MPHYANGKPANRGDLVICAPPYPNSHKTIGILAMVLPASDTCNGQIIALARQYGSEGPWYPATPNPYPDSVTLKECMAVGAEVPVPA